MTIENNNLRYTPENVYNDPVLGPFIVERYEKVTIHSIEDTKKAFETNFRELYKVLILPDGVRGPEEDRPLIRLLDFGVGSGRLILPFADGLRKQGVDVHVSGIDQSEYMLKALRANLKEIFDGGEFKGEDTFYFKSRDDTTGYGSFSLTLIHGDFNTDEGLDRALEHWLKELPNSTNSVNLRAIFFVQSWHYVQKRTRVFKKIEEAVDKKDKGKECLLIHFEPLGYLRLLDGDFGSSPELIQDNNKIPYGFKPIAGSTWDDRKRRQTIGLHLAFWHEYFAHRNNIYPYSAQTITAVQESVVFQEYRDRGYLEISGSQNPFIARMRHQVDFNYLMDLLYNPRFSAQYAGINADQRKDIAEKVRKMFEKESEQFKATVDHAYRARVFSIATKELNETRCSAIHLPNFKEETDPPRIVIPSPDAVRSYLRTFLSGVNVLFWGLTAIEAMGGTTSVLLSNMTRKNAWKGFLDKLEGRKLEGHKTVAEYMQGNGIENLMLRLDFNSNAVSCILEKEDFSPPEWTSEVDQEIRDVSGLLVKHMKENEKVLGHFIQEPEEEHRFFYLWYFMLFPRDRIETRFFNVVMTLILDSLPGGCPETCATAHFLKCVPGMLRAALADVFVPELKKANAEVMQKRHQAAAAAIISRNMSHNIGSHVIPRTGLDDLRKRVRKFHISNDLWSGPDWNWVGFPILTELKEKLDGYIQGKSEFIAEFTTDPLISISSAWFYGDIVFPFIRNTALIDTLAANEGFEYRNYDEPGLVIRCFRKDDGGALNEFLPRFNLYWNKADEPEQSKDEWFAVPYGERLTEYPSDTLIPAIKNQESDARVGLPGSVGEMAFFGILENLIRNSAKHGKRQKNSENARLEVHIVFMDSSTDPDHYKIDIYDNLTDPDGPGEQADETTVALVQRFIEKDIVDETGQCRKEAWGIAEMTLCAELLRGRDPSVAPKPRSLEARRRNPVKPFLDGSCDLACLTYSFSIMKARTAVFFGFEVDEDEQEKLKQRGFYFENPETLDTWRDDSSDQPLVFQFAVVHASLAESLLENLNRLPFRVIVVSTDKDSLPECVARTADSPPFIVEEETAKEMQTGNQKGTTDRLTHWLWKTWLEDWGRKKGIESVLGLDVYLEQEKDQYPTKTWEDCANAFNKAGGEDRIPAVIRVWGDDKKGVLCFTGKGKPRTDERRVIVDRHGKFVSESGYPPGKDDCLLVVDKASNDFGAIFNSRFSSPWQLPYELAEAGLLRILILDERIAQRSLAPFPEIAQAKEYFRDAVMRNREVRPTIWNIAERAGIFVATHLAVSGASSKEKKDFLLAEQAWRAAKKEQDSQKQEHEEGGKKSPPTRGWRSCPQLTLEIDLEDKTIHLRSNRFQPLENFHGTTSNGWETEGMPNDLSKDIDLVIVHQGIIDGVNKSFPKDGECFLDAVKKQVPWVVIESGRGIPPEVQKGREKFLSFSVIDRAFHGGRVAKLALTKALMELTRNKAS